MDIQSSKSLRTSHNSYWNKENCALEAKKYVSRAQFRLSSAGAYNRARLDGFLDEICTHMEILGNRNFRHIYAYEFSDKSVYVGLTYNINIRKSQHSTCGSVFNYIKSTGFDFKFVQITEKAIELKKAIELERKTLDKYVKDGWNKLNICDTGSTGSNIKFWVKEKCSEEAKKYSSRGEFKKSNNSAYNSAWKNGWLDDICAHMISSKKPVGFWTKEKCSEEAKKYNSITDFRNSSSGAYDAMHTNEWTAEMYSILPSKNTPK
jgi:predicted GIY-YIG superfamily endonuclease